MNMAESNHIRPRRRKPLVWTQNTKQKANKAQSHQHKSTNLSENFGLKLLHFQDFVSYLSTKGTPFPAVLAIPAVAVEALGPIALLLGMLPRVTSAILVIFTMIAAIIAHNFWSLPEGAARAAQQIQFLKNMAIIGGLLFYSVCGPGALTPRWRFHRS
jgi:putative oxidoreductase